MEPASHDRLTPLARASVVLPLAALAAYTVLASLAHGFYGTFNIALEEVGLTYAIVLGRSLPLGLVGGLGIMALAAIEVTRRHADRLLEATDRFPTWVQIVLLVPIPSIGAWLSLIRLPVEARAIVMLVATAIATRHVVRSRGRHRAPSSIAGLASIAGAVIVVLGVIAWGVGETFALGLHRDTSDPPLPTWVLPLRWPTAVQVEGEPDAIDQDPCLPLLLGSANGVHVLLERTAETTAVVRLPVEGHTLRSTFVRQRIERSGDAVVCRRR